MGRRITTVTEIKNICVLGLDVWVAPPIGVTDEAWKLKQPKLIRGKDGLMLGNSIINHDYLPVWGIRDPHCKAVLYIYEGNEYRLYNTKQAAQNAVNKRLAQT